MALIAQAYLEPSVGKAVSDLLAADTGSLTTHDIAGEATWADRIRNYQSGRERTAHWHYVDIEIDAPNVDQACFNRCSETARHRVRRRPKRVCTQWTRATLKSVSAIRAIAVVLVLNTSSSSPVALQITKAQPPSCTPDRR
jgi:S1/P1 Nuclease